MQTQIPSGAHNDEEAFQPPEMNLANEADENNDEAEADVEPRYGYWSSNKNKCLAALILAATIICVLAAGGSIKTAYDSKRSNAVGVATAYGSYGPVAATSAKSSKTPTSSSKATKSKSSKAPKSKSSKAPKSKSSKAPTSAPAIPCPS